MLAPVYAFSRGFPQEERYGLQSQLRRAALSAATNIVEGCARRSTGEYLNFLNIATGSAAEARYLVEVSVRLGFAVPTDGQELLSGYDQLVRGLKALVNGLQARP